MEIHSRKTQSARTRTSDQFRSCKQGIMFSSDVTARGMDYPDVTFVLQMGSTTKEQYTHRLGRTARAGKEGSGLLLCAPFEMSALQRDLRDMPLVVAEPPMLAGEVRVRVSHSQSYRHRYRQYICYSTDTITLHDTLSFHFTPHPPPFHHSFSPPLPFLPPITLFSPSPPPRSATPAAAPVCSPRSSPSRTCSNSLSSPGGRGWGTTTASRCA